MSNVLKFRQPEVKGTAKRPVADRWVCKTCEGNRFFFNSEDGLVECCGCGSFIVNLRVVKR